MGKGVTGRCAGLPARAPLGAPCLPGRQLAVVMAGGLQPQERASASPGQSRKRAASACHPPAMARARSWLECRASKDSM